MEKRRRGRSSSDKKQKACKISGMTENSSLAAFEEEFGSIKDYGQDTWNELHQEVIKNLSETVVPVASFIGNKKHFECTGIVIRSNEAGVSILTSADLVKSVDGDKAITSILMIQVRLPNKQVTVGRVGRYDLHYNVAIIIIPPKPGFRAAFFDVHMDFQSDSKVAAVGCWFYSGKFMATTGILIDEPTGEYPEHMRISTCKIPMVMTGGPLIDLDGNMVGMNFYSRERTLLLPSSKIFDFLVLTGRIEHEGPELMRKSTNSSTCTTELEQQSPKSNIKSTFNRIMRPHMHNYEGTSFGDSELEESVDEELDFHEPLPDDEFTKLLRDDLQPRGYPMPTRLEGGMRLVNNFEEEFAEDTWCKLRKEVASNTSRIVVSLASYKGETRFFACTGILVDFNEETSRILTSASLLRTSANDDKIDNSLKIQVYLPNKRLVTGTLQSYNSSYNVVVVSIGFRCPRTALLNNQVQIKPQMEVVAIGRVFESGKIMATSGIVTVEASKLDCKELMITTCKITMAGIGGPLIDFDGNFLGMNFYGVKETHFLPRNVIMEILKQCGAERAIGGQVIDSKSNRWPVPMPRWSYPSNRAPRFKKFKMRG